MSLKEKLNKHVEGTYYINKADNNQQDITITLSHYIVSSGYQYEQHIAIPVYSGSGGITYISHYTYLFYVDLYLYRMFMYNIRDYLLSEDIRGIINNQQK